MGCKSLILVAFCLLSSLVSSQTVDPRNLREWQKQKDQTKLHLSSWPVTRIKQLETLKLQLTNKIAQLPRHCPIISDNHLGYHSSLSINDGLNAPKFHQIDITLAEPAKVESFALIPAFNPLRPYGGSYAFPKRYNIEVQLPEQQGFIEIVNWLEQDFPNPGSYPVFFDNIGLEISGLRITAPSHSDGDVNNHFALGEVFIWARDEKTGRLDNLARAPETSISTSSSFNQTQKWHPDYLADLDTGLGFPIQELETNNPDLLIIPEPDFELPEQVEFVIDLQQERNISRIDFWPAKPRSNALLPDFGFPENIRVEVADNEQLKDGKIVLPESTGEKFGTLFSVRLPDKSVRFIKVTVNDLQRLNQQRILGLGEIAIYDANGSLFTAAKIKALGLPAKYTEQLSRLLDGYSWGRRIIPEQEWIKGLAQRRPLDRQLKSVNNQLALAHEYWEGLLTKILIGSGLLVVVMLWAGFALFQRSHRRQLLVEQGNRINRDLHDEVGSSLGSISLLADELATSQMNSNTAEDLNDLSLMAREANASLREVVWTKDDDQVMLSSLLQSLYERAERVMRGVKVHKSLQQNSGDIYVSLSVKRHLSMFFKEVIHNSARHSSATEIWLEAKVNNQLLSIEIRDNGCGFDSNNSNNGWGLKNLQTRAKEISGELHIESAPQQGCRIHLTLPVAVLSQEIEPSYQTSN